MEFKDQKEKKESLWRRFFDFIIPQKGLFSILWRLFFGTIALIIIYFLIVLGPLRTFTWHIPWIAGFFGETHHLVLFQNNYELRPTGGFISAYGVLTMNKGMPSLSIADSYSITDLKYRDAPKPLETFLAMDTKYKGWQFRDANFDPDYPSSVEDVLSFYYEKYPDIRFEGVWAVDMTFIEDLLEAYGPITVGGKEYTKENFFLETQSVVKNIDLHSEEALSTRKNILKPLGNALLSEVIGSPWSYGTLFNIIVENLDEKHIVLYFDSRRIHRRVEAKGWDGGFHRDRLGNGVYIESSNIGGRKGDRYINKHYDYTLTVDDDDVATVDITITFEHQGTYNLQSDLYQGYVRTYLPPGGDIIEVTGDYWRGLNDEFTYDDGELHKALYVGTYMHLFPQDKRVINIKYRLPQRLEEDIIPLNILKQPGTFNDLWTLTVRMPSDMSLENLSEDQMDVKDNVATWKGTLEGDLHFELKKLYDTYPPIVTDQLFTDLNTIEIYFDEDLDAYSAEKGARYSVVDLNHIAGSSDDRITVTNVGYSDKRVTLTVEGVSRTEEERYQVEIRDVQDLYGNRMQPNPFFLTVVQRLGE